MVGLLCIRTYPGALRFRKSSYDKQARSALALFYMSPSWKHREYLKMAETIFSPSPTHFCCTAPMRTLMKVAPDSFAMALTRGSAERKKQGKYFSKRGAEVLPSYVASKWRLKHDTHDKQKTGHPRCRGGINDGGKCCTAQILGLEARGGEP